MKNKTINNQMSHTYRPSTNVILQRPHHHSNFGPGIGGSGGGGGGGGPGPGGGGGPPQSQNHPPIHNNFHVRNSLFFFFVSFFISVALCVCLCVFVSLCHACILSVFVCVCLFVCYDSSQQIRQSKKS